METRSGNTEGLIGDYPTLQLRVLAARAESDGISVVAQHLIEKSVHRVEQQQQHEHVARVLPVRVVGKQEQQKQKGAD